MGRAAYTAFGAGALGGALATGYLRRLPTGPLVVGIVVPCGLREQACGVDRFRATSNVAVAWASTAALPNAPDGMAGHSE